MKKYIFIMAACLIVSSCQKNEIKDLSTDYYNYYYTPPKNGLLLMYSQSLFTAIDSTVNVSSLYSKNNQVDSTFKFYINDQGFNTLMSTTLDSNQSYYGKMIKIGFNDMSNYLDFYFPLDITLIEPDPMGDTPIHVGLKLKWNPDSKNNKPVIISLEDENYKENKVFVADNGEYTLASNLFDGLTRNSTLTLAVKRLNYTVYKDIKGDEYKIEAYIQRRYLGVYN